MRPGKVWLIGAMILMACALNACATTQASLTRGDAAIGLSNERAQTAAWRAIERSEYKQAQRVFESVLAKNPDDGRAKLGLAESLLGQNKTKSAQKYFLELTNLVDLRPEALQGQGLVELRQNNPASALSLLIAAIDLQPNLWRAWNGLGQANDLLGNWQASEEAYNRAIELAPKPAIVINNLGVSLLAQGKNEAALETFERARHMDPDIHVIEINRQLTLALLKRYEEATFRTKSGEKAKALNNAGYIALVQGDLHTAERLFVEAIEVNPTFYRPAFDNLQVVERLKRSRSENE